jgi:phosphomannomutase
MPPRFGTSGLRGLVTELTAVVVADHVRAYLAACDTGGTVWVGHDLRPSSPGLAAVVAETLAAAGQRAVMAGALPTPALVAAASGAGAIMVTGSHIPADRNGLKFYSRRGEITKAEETAIVAALGLPAPPVPGGRIDRHAGAGAAWVDRFAAAAGPGALSGRHIGVFAHSTVGRDLLAALLERLGARMTDLGRSDIFIPLDTEAVDGPTRARLRGWAGAHGLDAIVSADGDADRPLITDESGAVVPGDVLGQIAAELLGAETVVTPISSNSGVEAKGLGTVIRTRIGSPFVIAGMEAAGGRVAGYEANGGFLLGFDAVLPGGTVPALPTRDAMLPILCLLLAAGHGPVSARVAREPARFTASDRLQEVPEGPMRAHVAALATEADARAALLAPLGLREQALDLTDGVRIICAGGRIVHVRPSGNAPELRLYVETESVAASADLLARGLELLDTALAAAQAAAP